MTDLVLHRFSDRGSRRVDGSVRFPRAQSLLRAACASARRRRIVRSTAARDRTHHETRDGWIRLAANVVRSIAALRRAFVFAAALFASLAATAQEWTKVEPAGAQCWDGSPWHFWYRAGAADKLAIWFEGGGACWNAALCDVQGRATFDQRAVSDPQKSSRRLPTSGLFDTARANNPLRDYTVVYLPYCTGDVHVGRRTVEYVRKDGTRFSFAHRGANNTLAALDWLKERAVDPSVVFVSGESAGAIGAAYWALEIGDRYPRAQLIALGDAAGGYRSLGVNGALKQWGTLDALPDVPAYANRDRVFFETFYVAAAQRHPTARLGQVNYADDAEQRTFMKLLGTPVDKLTKPLTCNMNEVRIDAPQFHSYIYPGDRHVILSTNAVYAIRCNGQSLVDWVTDLIDGTPIENRWCDGTTATALASPVAAPPPKL